MSRPRSLRRTRSGSCCRSGELSSAQAARRSKVSETTIGNWMRQFLDGGAAAVEAGGKAGPNSAERALLDEVEDLKAALGEAHVELRVWK